LFLIVALPLFAQETRIASDFEMAQMERQLARSHDFLAQLSARLNLGDARLARNEPALARDEYAKALDVALSERLAARRDSSMARYATATSYAGLAAAKLGEDDRAWALLEESTRYASDSAKTWNVYASAMSLLKKPAKAAAASRTAIEIAQRDLTREASVANRLDLAVYQYALASALGNESNESERLLLDTISSLRSPVFDSLKHQVARAEQFEIYSSARGEASAYISLLNRAQLRLAALYEYRGDTARARQQYEAVLASRSDDPTALAALGRYAEAFDANPFSPGLVRAYREYVRTRRETIEGSTTGAQMRRTLVQMQRGELREARAELDALAAKFPANETIRELQHEIDTRNVTPSFFGKTDVIDPSAGDLRNTIALFDRITPEQRGALDKMTFTSTVLFDKPFASGTIDGVPFTFSEPMRFNGNFDAAKPLRLTYRILGATRLNDRDALLLEPVHLEEVRP
jgi:hypothetical protein